MRELPENIGLAVREIKSAIVRAQSRVAAGANAEMLARLREWTVEEGERQPQTDPRWKDLEKLKTIIKD